jgi:nitrate reductase gamma subunit
MSNFLRALENEVQIAALVFMAVVYSLRLVWLFRFRSRAERSWPVGRPGSGIGYSLLNIAMPWAMESSRTRPSLYIQFVLFHLGVATAIAVTFLIPYAPGVLRPPIVAWAFRLLIAAGFVVGLMRLARRLRDRTVRLISTADDYASLILIILYFAVGFFSVSNDYRRSELPLLVFFALTAVFLAYVPFSKIGHYLYYPFTHFFLGRTLGRRGVYPLRRHSDAAGPQPHPPEAS